ncbi:hypothetical protein F7725_026864, partial [Dissostichus mawsoni]
NATSKERSSIQCAGCDCCHPKRRKWVRTGISGMICDFDVYQGSVNGIRAKSELGLSARQVRLPNCNLEEEKSLKKKGRGSFDIRVEANHNICTSGHTCVILCWTRPMKSRRWYVYIFWHTIILAVINAWLLYKRECRALNMAKQEILNRRQFQADLASSLILRGRPSSGNGSPAATVTSRSPLNAQKRPSSGDGSPPNRAPSKRSNTKCTKCDVRLCFSDNRNCFWDYHCIHI